MNVLRSWDISDISPTPEGLVIVAAVAALVLLLDSCCLLFAFVSYEERG